MDESNLGKIGWYKS